MSGNQDLNELRQIAASNTSSDGNGTVVLFAASFAVVFALVLGGMVAYHLWFSDPVAATTPAKVATAEPVKPSHKGDLFDNALRACTRKFDKKHKGDKGMALGMDIGKAFRESGSPLAIMHALKIKCIGNHRPGLFCDAKFRQRFVDLIGDYHRAGAMFKGLVALGNSMQGHRHDRYMEHLKGKKGGVYYTIHGLFKRGYLQRKDFFSVVWGTPKWVKRMTGDRTLPERPCRPAKS